MYSANGPSAPPAAPAKQPVRLLWLSLRLSPRPPRLCGCIFTSRGSVGITAANSYAQRPDRDDELRDARGRPQPDRRGGVSQARLYRRRGGGRGAVQRTDGAARDQDAQRAEGAAPGRPLRVEGGRLQAGGGDREAADEVQGRRAVEREPEAR